MSVAVFMGTMMWNLLFKVYSRSIAVDIGLVRSSGRFTLTETMKSLNY